MFRRLTLALAAAAALLATTAQADEADIRRNLAQRLPRLGVIESVQASPMPGLYEVVANGEVMYSDEKGNFVLRGDLLQLSQGVRNLTEERRAKLQVPVDFAKLPLKDAVVWKSGNGKRRVAVFSDPFCTYCKQLEREMQQVKDVTVYTFMVAMISRDSPKVVRDVWCAKDSTQVWLDWMLRDVMPKRAMGDCEMPLDRNMALANRLRVRGTPAVMFEDGSVTPGMMMAPDIETKLASVKH